MGGRLNLDRETLTLDGGMFTLNGGDAHSRWGDVSPYNLSTGKLGPFYTSRVFMHINICMSFHSRHFARFSFFHVYTEKDIRRKKDNRRNWTEPLL